MSTAESEKTPNLLGSLPFSREHQICELIVKIQLRLESALDKLLDCQRKKANLLRLERMDIRTGLTLSQNIPICQTRLRLQSKLKEQTKRELLVSVTDEFDLEREKGQLDSQAQELRREIEVLKSKADMWKHQLNI